MHDARLCNRFAKKLFIPLVWGELCVCVCVTVWTAFIKERGARKNAAYYGPDYGYRATATTHLFTVTHWNTPKIPEPKRLPLCHSQSTLCKCGFVVINFNRIFARICLEFRMFPFSYNNQQHSFRWLCHNKTIFQCLSKRCRVTSKLFGKMFEVELVEQSELLALGVRLISIKHIRGCSMLQCIHIVI